MTMTSAFQAHHVFNLRGVRRLRIVVDMMHDVDSMKADLAVLDALPRAERLARAEEVIAAGERWNAFFDLRFAVEVGSLTDAQLAMYAGAIMSEQFPLKGAMARAEIARRAAM